MARRLGAVVIALALTIVSAVPGADHEVQQVTGPNVEKEDVGRFMEVDKSYKRHATGCLSCTLGGMGTSSTHSNNGYSTASYGMAGGNSYGAVTNPQSASSRREFRREEQYVNGQPVYQLQHERRYQDGRLVHDERMERDEDDLGYSPESSGGHYNSHQASSMTRSGTTGSRYGHDGYYTRPSYSTGMSDEASQSYGASESGYSSSQSQDHFQRNFEEEVDRMRNQLRNTMDSHMSQQPSYGGSRRSEYHYQTQYVNGQPVYRREGDLRYEDGELVHNRTQEVGSPDQGSYSGGYGHNGEHQGYHSTSSQASHNTHPGYTYYPSRRHGYTSYNQWQTSSSYANNSPTSGYPSAQQPTHGSSSTAHRDYSSQSSSPSSAYPARRPGYDTSSTRYGEESGYSSSSYPHSNPSSGSSSTHYSEEERRHSSSASYPGYRPTSDASTGPYRPNYGSSSTHYSEDRSQSSSSSYQPTSSSSYQPTSSSSYQPTSSSSHQPNYRPTQGSSSTTYREGSYYSSSSNPSNQPATTTHTPADLDVTRVQQNFGIPSGHRPSTTTTHHATQESSYSRESQGGYGHSHSQGGGYRGRGHTDTSEEDHEEHYGTTSGGARTVTLDLSNPNSGSRPSFSDHLLRPSHSGRRHDTDIDDEDDLQQQTDNDIDLSQSNVGIPGVLSGPHTPRGREDDHDEDEDDENSERYDISPLEDGFIPTIPPVDNEIETAYGVRPDRPDTEDDRDSDYQPHRPRPGGSGTASVSYHYTHTGRNEEETRHGSPSGTSDRPGYSHTTTRDGSGSHTTTRDGSGYVRPISGSSTYHYNETRRRTSTATGHHQQPVPGSSTYSSSSSSSCTYGDGCVIHGEPQTSSRRSEIRTTRRYVNGRLVGMTTHERQYENGVMVNENRTEYDRDEVARMFPEEARANQMDLTQGTYGPGSYSQQHEFRTERRFFNGQPVYELNHERRYEDGALVYNNSTEKNEDDFRREGVNAGQLGGTSVHGGSGYGATHTRHHHRVASDRTSDTQSTQHSQGRQTGDTTRVLTVPVYSSRRFESRREQEFVDGQPVYDLHHERRFQDGSLVHENRTELNEDDLVGGGHRDALHEILAGNVYTTATQAPHGRPVQTGYGTSTYSSSSSSSSHGASSGHTAGSYDRTGDSYDQTSGSYDRTSSSYGQTSGSSDESSSTYSQSGMHGHGYASQDHSNTGSGTFTSSLLGRGNVGSGRATTTVLGGSGTLLTGSDSTRSLEDRDDNSRVSGSTTYSSSHSSSSHVQGSGGSGSYVPAYGSYGHSTEEASSEDTLTQSRVQSGYGESGSQFGSVLSQGGHGSGRATTTVLGGSGTGASSGYSGGSYGSSYESQSSASQVRHSGGSGCLSCVLTRGGSGAAGQDSHGYAGGRSYGREMSVEEHYEDGRLVRGRHDSRRYEDGNLVHEDTRHYSDDEDAQRPRAEALGGQSSSSSSSSYSSSSYSSSSSSSSSGSEVCESNPCLNGGTCLPGLYDAICTCQFGFTGRRCEEAECPRGYCRRGGECSIKDGNHVCSCRAGYEGPRCMERSERRFRRFASRP